MKKNDELKLQVKPTSTKVIEIENGGKVTLHKIDLVSVGNTIFKDEDGNTAFMTDLEYATKDDLFLRVTLKCIDDEYIVTGHEMFHCDECGADHVVFFTNLPYDIFEEEMENC